MFLNISQEIARTFFVLSVKTNSDHFLSKPSDVSATPFLQFVLQENKCANVTEVSNKQHHVI